MEMFTRDALMGGPPVAVREWAVGICEAFGEATGRTPQLWMSVAGGIAGHYTWAMECDGAAEVMDLTMRAFADEAYLAAIEQGREFLLGQPRDTIYRPLNNVPSLESAPGAVCSVITAVSAAGSLGHAVGWGLEATDHVTTITGARTAFMGCMAGEFSRLTWLTVHEDAQAADAAARTMNSDDEYLKLIGRGGQYFTDGSARTQMFVRLA